MSPPRLFSLIDGFKEEVEEEKREGDKGKKRRDNREEQRNQLFLGLYGHVWARKGDKKGKNQSKTRRGIVK